MGNSHSTIVWNVMERIFKYIEIESLNEHRLQCMFFPKNATMNVMFVIAHDLAKCSPPNPNFLQGLNLFTVVVYR